LTAALRMPGGVLEDIGIAATGPINQRFTLIARLNEDAKPAIFGIGRLSCRTADSGIGDLIGRTAHSTRNRDQTVRATLLSRV
jgi:hypothetical protein